MVTDKDTALPHYRLREQFTSIDELPALPDTAAGVLRLKNKPNANSAELIDLIRQDPALAAKILHYANSAYFGYRGEVESIEQAVVRVMGYDAALSIALTVSLLGAFYRQDNFGLGLDQIRRHVVYSASLAQELAMVASTKLQPGLAFAGGLLQEIGYFVLAYRFPVEFRFYTRVAPVISGKPALVIEEQVLGVTHMELGKILLTHWGLPAEIVSVAAHHHQENYNGEHAGYAHLVLVANRLVARLGIGNEISDELPPYSMEVLGLSAETAARALERLFEKQSELDQFAAHFAA